MEPRTRSTRSSLGGGGGGGVQAVGAGPPTVTPSHGRTTVEPLSQPSPAAGLGQQGSSARRTKTAGQPSSLLPPSLAQTLPSSPIAIAGYQPPAPPAAADAAAAAASTGAARPPSGPPSRTASAGSHRFVTSTLAANAVLDSSSQHPPAVEPLAFALPQATLSSALPAAAGRGPPSATAAPQSSLQQLSLDAQPSSSLDTSPLHPHSSSSCTTAAGAQHPSSSAARPPPPSQPQLAHPSKLSAKPLSAALSSKASLGAGKRASSSGSGGAGSKKKKASSASAQQQQQQAEDESAATAAAAGAAAEGSSGAFRAGDLNLEFKTVDGSQMVLGKGGKWFDFNPGPNGTGMKDGEVVFECFMCDKIYLGIHARSIWRRHLKDKHKIPLSLQPRRTRWDGREDVDDKKDKGKKKASAKRPKPSKASQGGPSSVSSTGGGAYSDSNDFSHDDGTANGSESEIEGLTPSGSGSRARGAGAGKGKGRGKGVRGRMASPPATIVEEFGEGGRDDGYASSGGGGRDSPEYYEGEYPQSSSYAYAHPGGFHPHHQHHPEQQYYYQAPYGSHHPEQQYAHPEAYDGHPQAYAQGPTSASSSTGGYPAGTYPAPPPLSHLVAYPPHMQQHQQYAYSHPHHHHPEQQYAYPPYSSYATESSSFARDEPHGGEPSTSGLAADGQYHPQQQQHHQQQQQQHGYPSAPDIPHGRTIYRRSSFPPSLRNHAAVLAPELISPVRSVSAAPDSPSRAHIGRRYGAGRGPDGDEGGAAELLMQLKQSSPLKPNPDDEAALDTGDESEDGAGESVRGGPAGGRRAGSTQPGPSSQKPKSALLPAHELLPAADLLDATMSRRSRSVSRSSRVHSPAGKPGRAGGGAASPPVLGRIKDETLDPASYSLAGADGSLRTHLHRSPAFPHPSSPFQPPSSSPVIGRAHPREPPSREAFVTPYGKFAARRAGFRPQQAADDEDNEDEDDEVNANARANGADADADEHDDGDDDDEPERASAATVQQPSSPAFPTDDSPRPTKEGVEQAAGRRRDAAPLVPLFAQPQLPQRRSITATTPLISSLTRTTLPAWHPTPLKSSSTMTALDYTPVVSSTRTPFKSSSGSKSTAAESADDRVAPLKSIRYTPGAFGAHLGSTPGQPSLSNGSSPPQSMLSVLSSPQSLGLTRSLGLAPATPGGQWDHLHSNTFGTPDDNLLIGSLKKRRGSWAVGPTAPSGSSSTLGASGGSGKERPRKKARASLDGPGGSGTRDSGFFDAKDAAAVAEDGSGEETTPTATDGAAAGEPTAAAAVVVVKDTAAADDVLA